jgi:shikimate dehydrogenase
VGTDITVHATSVGLFSDVDALPEFEHYSLRPDMVVAHGIHNPPLPPLLQAAPARGCKTTDGMGMLVNQGVIDIKYRTGIDADPRAMWQAPINLKL